MNFRRALIALCLVSAVGCAHVPGGGAFLSAFRFHDTAGPGDSKGDPWVQDAGKITRTEHTREEVYDPLHLRELTMSEQARSIERNLGVGD
ncbi:MAG: hypothetical protein R3C18_10525 [Planctomycetaceae bacterium]